MYQGRDDVVRISRPELKRQARKALSGRLGLPILAAVLVTVLNVICGYAGAWLFPGTGILSLIMGEVFAFVVTLIICVFQAGMYYMFLNMARGRSYSLQDLLYFFRHQPDRVIMASFVLALIAWLTALPASIYNMTAPMPADLEQQLSIGRVFLILYAAGLLVNVLLTIPFAMTYYLMADDENLTGFAALMESVRMMKGHMIEYILLEASFIPWLLLAFITMYLSMLWTVPYMEMTHVMFYRHLLGEQEEYTNEQGY